MQPNSATAINLNSAQIEAIARACVRFAFTDEESLTFLERIIVAGYEERELIICAADPQYFVVGFCKIYDAQAADWIRFELWNEQIEALNLLHDNQKVIALKARQLGLTWLAIAYALWMMLFRPIASVLIFSKRDDEAVYLLSEERLRGVYNHLPDWMKAITTPDDSAHMLSFSNGSSCRAFPTTAGDSYTASFVIIDESDLILDQNKLMRSVKPTIDAGGKLLLISRADKSRPSTEFKNIYEAAKKGLNGWAYIFLAWFIRPERTQAWYEEQKREIFQRTGALDDLYEQYPATDEEALLPAQRSKRIPLAWLNECYIEQQPIPLEDIPFNPKQPALLIDGLRVFKLPEQAHIYGIAADCAEGLASSDDSVSQVMDLRTGEQVAVLSGKFTPKMHAAYTARLAQWYNGAKIAPENNNHGHAFILWLEENRFGYLLIEGHDGKKGWSSNTIGKVLMYDAAAQGAKDREYIIHDKATKEQLLSIEKDTLRAPQDDKHFDDHADAWAILVAIRPTAISFGNVAMKQARVKGR